MKKFILLLLLPLAAGMALADNHIVQGRVVNNANGELLEMAAVRAFTYSGSDSTLVTGAQTDQNGGFMLRLPKGTYGLIISNVGYFTKKVECTVGDKDVNLKSIALKEDVQDLKEVEVRGTAAELTVRGDTLEYNAAAYKVNENAMVEDLLKKMSGVTVGTDGSVTVNGESIKAVRIDGKKFFGDDVQSATKNIPADMVDKIQVVDQKSDMAKMTGIEDDDTERIINLTLKQNKKKGMFGNFSGALGSDALGDDQSKLFHYNYQGTAADKTKQFFSEDFRYNANAFMNLMLGESQTTIIAGANNTNDARSGRGRGWRPGGGEQSGITWAENVGVNTNVSLNDKWTFGGDVNLNHTYNTTNTQSEKQQYTEGETFNNSDSTRQQSRGWDVNARLEFEYNADSLNTLLLKPNLSYTRNWTNKQNDFLYLSGDSDALALDTLSYGRQINESLSNEISADIEALYTHRFASKKGRSLSFDLKGNISSTTSGSYNQAMGSITPLNQYQDKKSQSGGYSLRVTYIEPIWKQEHYLQFTASFGQTLTSSDKLQYLPDENGQYTLQDTAYSNSFLNNYLRESLGVDYRYLKGPVDLTVGVRANPSQTHSTTTYADGYTFDTLNTVWNFAPRLTFKYKLGKRQFARIIYRGRTTQPSVSQMEPVRDNSDAMSETVGNLGLNPSFAHNIFAFYSQFNQDKMSSLNTGIHATITKDALVYNTIYDETGKVYRQTVNAKGTPFDASWDLMFNTPIIKNRLHFFTRTEIGYNQRLAYVTHSVPAADIDLNNFLLGDESKTGNLRAREELSLRVSHDVVDFGLRGNLTYSRTQNTQALNVTNTLDWGVTADFTFHLPYNWSISTDFGYNDKWGYNLEGSMRELMWNAKIDKTWQNATLSLNLYDILNQKKNVVETIGENYIQYQRFNTLPTYFSLSFTYKLNRMGKLKAKGAGAFMQEMIESGNEPGKPGKGTPPVGPPPFMR